MKRLLLCLAVLTCCASCCAKPVVIDNGVHTRVFTPCTDNNLCFRDTYNIAWDSWCTYGGHDYPVSYRTKQTEYESGKVEYILMPKSMIVDTYR